MKTALKLVEYSEKSFAIIGDSKDIKDNFKVEGKYIARFNKFLSIKDENTQEVTKQAGWIFPLKHRLFVETIVNDYIAKNQPPKVEDVFVTSTEPSTQEEEEEEQKALF